MLEDCCICKLPDELLLKIVQCIPTSELKLRPGFTAGSQAKPERRPLSDYRSVSLVCRRFNRVATTVMYAHYTHEFDNVSSVPFIMTIFQQPKIAQAVQSMKEVSVRSRYSHLYKTKPYRRPAASIESLLSIVQHLDVPDRDSIADLFQSGRDIFYDWEAALILALTPNIRTLALNFAPGEDYPQSAFDRPRPSLQMIGSAARGLPYGRVHQFEQLQKLKLNMGALTVNSISSVLRLKSLVDLTLFNYTSPINPPENLTWDCPLRGSSVKTIRLDDFMVDVPPIVNLISSCRSLEGFALRASFQYTNLALPNYSLLVSELQRHQPGLQYLSISEDRIMDKVETGKGLVRFGNLENFRNLKYLAVPLELLIGLDVSDTKTNLNDLLPQNLQTLILTKGQTTTSQNKQFGRNSCDKHIQSILHACQARSLNLNALGIQYQTDFKYTGAYDGYASSPKDLARMEDVHFDFFKFTRDFKECGVHFDYQICVSHGQEHEAHDRLISVRRIHGDAVADEYLEHLNSSFDSFPCYEICIGKPQFLQVRREDERFEFLRD